MMADKDDTGHCAALEVGKATDYDCELPSDTLSLSDSDPEDKPFLNEPEVDTVSLEDFPQGAADSDVSPERNTIHSLMASGEQLPSQAFQLKGMSSSFSLRSQSIFDCLESVAKCTTSPLSDDDDSLFKLPLLPAPQKKCTSDPVAEQQRKILSKPVQSLPDYIEHPERWTKYSLAEVSETSDKKNRMVALEFLDSLQKRKEEKVNKKGISYSFNQDHASKAADKIVFIQPSKMLVEGCTTEDTLQEKSVEGDGQKKLLKRASSSKGASEKVGLPHLVRGDLESEEGGKRPDFRAVEQGKEEAGTESESKQEARSVVNLGFYCSKKRIRKNIRTKSEKEDDSD